MLVGKPLSEHHGGVRLAFVQFLVASVVLTPFALAADWGEPVASWWWLVVIGFVHTALGLGLFLGALGRMPATTAGILAYLEPAAAVLFGWLLLAEQPGVGTLAGGALILAAGRLVTRPAGPASPVASPEVAGVPG